ncbi:Nucleolar GTPase [Quillaja saponaria]|uniref:Nucleolar GTPase n=1 Tax=Quillaja saponaria TaxID=32244 RepID=A0AAD7VF63_QUISA|nr:Nucleolar GTPase [Quillaja saponaria]
MADNQAEDDDDESFGDYKFVPYPNHVVNSKKIEDDWGDFIHHSNHINGGFELSNGLSHTQLPSKPSETSIPIDLFAVSVDHTEKYSSHEAELSRVQVEPSPTAVEKSNWAKPQGALPLSIFGEMEEEEEPSTGDLAFSNDANFFSSKNGDSVKSGSQSNKSIQINDLLENLYNQSPPVKAENGPNSIFGEPDKKLSGANSSNGNSSIRSIDVPNSDTNGLNSDTVEGNEDVDDDEDDGWEFKVAESEIRIENGNSKVDEKKQETVEGAGHAFGFSNGAQSPSNLFDSSHWISQKSGQWDLGFEFNQSSVSQDGITSNSQDGLTGLNANFWENAFQEPGSKHKSETTKVADISPTSVGALVSNGGGPRGSSDSSIELDKISNKSGEWDFDFNFDPSSKGEQGTLSESCFKNKQDENVKTFDTSPINEITNSDIELGEFKDAFIDIGLKHEGGPVIGDISPLDGVASGPSGKLEREIRLENHRDTLSFGMELTNEYGDEKLRTNDPFVHQDVSNNAPSSYPRNSIKVNNDDDDDSWEFKDANYSTNYTPKAIEDGLQTSPIILDSNLGNVDDDDFEGNSWEFKDTFSGTRSQDQASISGNSSEQLTTKLELVDYVDFYCKFKDELCYGALCHIDNLKKAQGIAALSSDHAKVKAIDVEIQEVSDILHQDDVISKDQLENHSPRNMCLNELVEVLKEPKFQFIESEYQLASKLSMAEKDLRCTIELLKHAASTLRILKLRSSQEQSNYLTTWSNIVSICSQELKHGAFIWKQSLGKNIHKKILSTQQGKQYILALGEIYRVVEVIGASAKLYNPWILLSGSVLLALLNECYIIWSSSKLDEALQSIQDPSSFEDEEYSRVLLESIKYIHDLDEHALQSNVISGQEPSCQLSGLPAGLVPGLKMVVWNGKHYFLKLANLWANLVSSDPPKL